MKNLIYKKYIKYYVLLLVAMSSTACDKYLDVDTDVDNPTTAALDQLLPNIERTITQIGDSNNFLAEILQVYTHQLVSRSEQDQYGAQSPNTNMNNDWNNVYLGLTDIETLISQAQISGDRVYLGIGQALKAYVASVAVDVWGDVPFSEATLLTSGTVSPVF